MEKDKQMKILNRIIKINDNVNDIVSNADLEWEEKYELIFSEKISKKVFELINLDYYDPDTTYEEDVMAFAYELNNWINDFEQFEELRNIKFFNE